VKLAKKHGVEELLPPGKKATEYKAVRLAEVGLRVRGTGIGQKVKGHQWERAMAWKLEQRRKAMLKMPAMIREWKQVSGIRPPRLLCCAATDLLYSTFSAVTDVAGRNTRRNELFGQVSQNVEHLERDILARRIIFWTDALPSRLLELSRDRRVPKPSMDGGVPARLGSSRPPMGDINCTIDICMQRRNFISQSRTKVFVEQNAHEGGFLQPHELN
jgi:hypothetical protein